MLRKFTLWCLLLARPTVSRLPRLTGGTFRRCCTGWAVLRGGESTVTDPYSSLQNDALPKRPLGSVQVNGTQPPGVPNVTDHSSTEAPVPEVWRRALPERLRKKSSKTMQKLRLGKTDIYLLGTAHVSNESAADAEVLLEHVQPECVFVELCDARIPLMEDDSLIDIPNNNGTEKTSFFEKVRMTQSTQQGTKLQAISTVLLTSIQESYAEDLDVELGGEFRKAFAYWKSRPQTHLILGDRPLQLTLFRAWEALRWWPKLKLFCALLVSSIRKPNKEEIRKWLESIMLEETDVLTKSFDELRKAFPSLYRVILEERDSWLAAKLYQTCRLLQGQQKTIVAIVGAGHVAGICNWLTTGNNSTASPEEILASLTVTRRWASDTFVQNQLLPSWVHDVCELQRDLYQ